MYLDGVAAQFEILVFINDTNENFGPDVYLAPGSIDPENDRVEKFDRLRSR